MLRIESITLREIALALKEPFQISSGTQSRRRIFLLELTSADGVVAWSECVAAEFPNYGPETIDTCWFAIREWVAPRVLGRSFAGPEEVHPVLEHNFRGHHMAKAAVEMGAWELAARTEGISLSARLGGTRSSIRVGISLGIQDSPAALVEKARAALERGYRKVKIKIKPGADLAYVRAVREALGPEAPLMADANNAYDHEDIAGLQALDELGLMMIEQPLAWDDLLRHAHLQNLLKTPICLDESITGVERVEDMLHLGAGRIVNIKPGRVGGFTSSKAIHDLCAGHGIPVWCGGMLESGVGRGHNVALASLPNFTLPGDLSPSERYWEQDIVTPEWTMDGEGWIEVPVDRPGIGVEVDRDRVENLTVRREELRALVIYRALADALVVFHLGFVLFVCLGGLLVLRWRRVAWGHLPAAVWGAFVEFTQTICPLTPLENRLRHLGGKAGYSGGFIEHHITRVLYPEGLSQSIQIALGVFVVLLNVAVYTIVFMRRRRLGAA